MSDLRKHLQSAKEAHHAARYAGDLAADVLIPRMSIGRQLMIGASVAGAIAAVLAMIVWVGSHPTSNQKITAVVRSPLEQPTETQQETILLPFTIERPADAQLTASVSDSTSATNASATDDSISTSMPAVWGFPTVSSIQEELSSQTQTEEESS